MTNRRLFLLTHRINGLLLATFLTIVGLTGSLLAFNPQLERLLAPTLFTLPPHTTLRADPIQVLEAVQQAYPWANVDTLDLSTKPDSPLVYFLDPKPHAPNPHDGQVYADPYTARVLGSRRYTGLHQGARSIMPFIYELHQDLALDTVGALLLGLASLLWTIDCFIGLYLTSPPTHRTVETISTRIRRFPARWLPSWLIRLTRGPFKRLYDLHRAPALYLWLMLLLFAWTGVLFNLPAVARPILHALGASAPTPLPSRPCPAPDQQSDQPLPWHQALAEARTRMAAEATRHAFTVKEERLLSYNRYQCQWLYRVRSTRDADRLGNTQILWSPGFPAQTLTLPTGTTPADTTTTWLKAIHESRTADSALADLSLRLLVCASGLLTAFLSLTGILLFLRKLRR